MERINLERFFFILELVLDLQLIPGVWMIELKLVETPGVKVTLVG